MLTHSIDRSYEQLFPYVSYYTSGSIHLTYNYTVGSIPDLLCSYSSLSLHTIRPVNNPNTCSRCLAHAIGGWWGCGWVLTMNFKSTICHTILRGDKLWGYSGALSHAIDRYYVIDCSYCPYYTKGLETRALLPPLLLLSHATDTALDSDEQP